MKIIASVVLKNEANRYLRSCLDWNSVWWDELFVYDDQSTDETVSICAPYATAVVIRKDGDPSFLEHEGRYRSCAWAAMEMACQPSSEDFVFSFDADEFLVGAQRPVDLRAELRCTAVACLADDRDAADIEIPEIWATDPLRVRTDGYWGTMFLPRLVRYRPDWSFRNKPMGCGSAPEYSYRDPLHVPLSLRLLHFGYACPEDRKARSDRYRSLEDHGHSRRHIDSILARPELSPWNGQAPTYALGSWG